MQPLVKFFTICSIDRYNSAFRKLFYLVVRSECVSTNLIGINYPLLAFLEEIPAACAHIFESLPLIKVSDVSNVVAFPF